MIVRISLTNSSLFSFFFVKGSIVLEISRSSLKIVFKLFLKKICQNNCYKIFYVKVFRIDFSSLICDFDLSKAISIT